MIRLFTIALLSATVFPATCLAQENPIFDHLMKVGVPVNKQNTIELPAPSMKAGLAPDKEQMILDTLRGRRPLKDFVRDSRVAPFNLRIASKKNKAGERIGQTLNLWFVCYGDLKNIEEKQFMQALGGLDSAKGPDNAVEQQLTIEDLKSRGITPNQMFDERFTYTSGPLLNRVRIGGVTRFAITRSDKEVMIASVLDTRFADDKQFPNQWQSQKRDDQGRIVLGKAEKYAGYGGYGKATQLQQPKDAILVEFHLAINEPRGWFNGANLLGSKLGVVVQNKVRDFRTTLANLRNAKE